MPTPPTLTIELKNETNSNTVYAYITGTALDHNGSLFLLKRDGATPYYPTSPAADQSHLTEDCAIPLGPPGSTKPVTVPHLGGARIWFSISQPLTFLLNRGPALIEPSVSNPSDPNININWGFAEFTYNNDQLYANISYVDFVSIPISLTLSNYSGSTSHVSGMPSDGLQRVISLLQSQDTTDHAGWSSLIQKASSGPSSGQPLRVLSPNTGMVMNPSLFHNYYTSYVNQCWDKYTGQPLSVNTQSSLGTITGTVSNGLLTLGGETFAKPTERDIFSCSTGPFEERGSAVRSAIIPRLAAALNRTTLLADNTIPDDPPAYYSISPTNHYSRVVHSVNLDGRGYAFPYDDVGPSTGGKDESGSVFDGNPRDFTVAVSGVGASAPGVFHKAA